MMANYAEIEKMSMMELLTLYQAGSEAERRMIETKVIIDNDKLITHLLKKHFPSYIRGHYDDMCQEARIAITQHFKNFDPERGRFSTYISTYILEAFKKYICNLHGISSHYFTQLKRFNQAVASLSAKGFQNITADMIADEMGVGLDAILAVSAIRDQLNHVSIDGDEKDRNLTDLSQFNPEEQFARQAQSEALAKALSRLSEAERKVIIAAFLNEEEKELPLREVSRRLNMEISSVRRLKNKALRQLSRDSELVDMTGGVRDIEVQDFADSITIDFVMPKESVDENLSIALTIEI